MDFKTLEDKIQVFFQDAQDFKTSTFKCFNSKSNHLNVNISDVQGYEAILLHFDPNDLTNVLTLLNLLGMKITSFNIVLVQKYLTYKAEYLKKKCAWSDFDVSFEPRHGFFAFSSDKSYFKHHKFIARSVRGRVVRTEAENHSSTSKSIMPTSRFNPNADLSPWKTDRKMLPTYAIADKDKDLKDEGLWHDNEKFKVFTSLQLKKMYTLHGGSFFQVHGYSHQLDVLDPVTEELYDMLSINLSHDSNIYEFLKELERHIPEIPPHFIVCIELTHGSVEE